jgi:hypothetical protein
LEGVDLEVGLLVGGGDAGVAERVSHPSTVAEPCDSHGCATLIVDTGSERLLSGSWGEEKRSVAVTQDDLLYRFRLRTLALAAELGNVRAACRAMGIHPSTY